MRYQYYSNWTKRSDPTELPSNWAVFCLCRYPNRHYLFVKLRIEGIIILGIKVFLYYPQSLSKPLEVNYLSFSQKLDRIFYVRVICKSQNIIICCSCFLLWYDGVRTTSRNDQMIASNYWTIIFRPVNFVSLFSHCLKIPMNFNRYDLCYRVAFTDGNMVYQVIYNFTIETFNIKVFLNHLPVVFS